MSNLLLAATAVVVLVAGLVWASRPLPREGGPTMGRTWTRASGDAAAFADGVVSDVVGASGQVLAVGSVPEGDRVVAAAWVSWQTPSGLPWLRLPGDPSLQDAIVERAAVSGLTAVALGQGESAGGQAGGSRIWTIAGQRICEGCSAPPTGDPWHAARTSLGPSGSVGLLFDAVTAGGPGFVAVGTATTIDAYGGTTVGAAVATSVDGSTWTFGESMNAALVGGSMGSVTAGSSGLVAVGDVAGAPTAWLSTDGLTWTRMDRALSPPAASVSDVAAGAHGYVAVGANGSTATSWASSDGRHWEVAPASSALSDARMTRVFWLGSEFVAIGQSDGGDGAVWHSADGLSWTRFDIGTLLAGVKPQAAGVVGSRYLVFGTDTTGRLLIVAGNEQP